MKAKVEIITDEKIEDGGDYIPNVILEELPTEISLLGSRFELILKIRDMYFNDIFK